MRHHRDIPRYTADIRPAIPVTPPATAWRRPPTTNTLAIGSLIASILSLPMLAMCATGLFVALVGIGLGVAALGQIKRSGQAGRGLAIAGITVGAVGALLNGGWMLLFLVGLFAA